MNVDPKINDIDPEAPLDPAVERVRAKLARLMGVSITIMLVSVMAVLGTIVYKVSDSKTLQAANAPSVFVANMVDRVGVPAGSQVMSHSYRDGLLSLHLRLADGSQMIRLVALDGSDEVRDISLEQQ